jgi:ferredoxin
MKLSKFAIKLKDKCVLGFGKEGFEDGSKMVEKNKFIVLEKKHVQLICLWCGICVFYCIFILSNHM